MCVHLRISVISFHVVFQWTCVHIWISVDDDSCIMHLTIMEQTRTKTYDTRDKLDIRMFRMLHTQFRGTTSVLRSRPGQHVTRASVENVACEQYIHENRYSISGAANHTRVQYAGRPGHIRHLPPESIAFQWDNVCQSFATHSHIYSKIVSAYYHTFTCGVCAE